MAAIELKAVVTNSMHSTSLTGDAENGNDLSYVAEAAAHSESSRENNLIQYCVWNSPTLKFLQATANYWPNDGNRRSLDQLYYGLTRLVNIGSIFANFFGVCATLGNFDRNYRNEVDRYTSAGIAFAVIVRTASVLVVQYLNQCRMQKPAHSHEILVLEESAKIAGIYGVAVFLLNIVSTILFIFSSGSENAGFYVTEYFLGTYLSFNLFFLVLDVKASSVSLDQLHLLADERKLRMGEFLASRADIHRGVNESRWACDLIIFPCLASAAGILVLIIYFLDTPARLALKIEAAAFVCLLLKELLFVMVAFWYVAKVNARADELTIKLSRDLWELSEPLLSDKNIAEVTHNSEVLESSDQSSIHSQERTPSNVDLECDIAHATDTHRLSIHASSISEPISFTLLFKRVSWKNVAVSAGGFVLAIFIAVVKNAVEQTIEK